MPRYVLVLMKVMEPRIENLLLGEREVLDLRYFNDDIQENLRLIEKLRGSVRQICHG